MVQVYRHLIDPFFLPPSISLSFFTLFCLQFNWIYVQEQTLKRFLLLFLFFSQFFLFSIKKLNKIALNAIEKTEYCILIHEKHNVWCVSVPVIAYIARYFFTFHIQTTEQSARPSTQNCIYFILLLALFKFGSLP